MILYISIPIIFLFSFPGQNTNEIFFLKKLKINTVHIGKKFFNILINYLYHTYVTPGNELFQ